MPEEKEFMTLDEAVESLGTTRGTIYNYMKDLSIKTSKFGRDKRGYLSREQINLIRDYKENPWRVTKYDLRIPIWAEHFEKYIQSLGLKPVTECLVLPEMIPATKQVASLMKVPEGTLVIHRSLRQGMYIAEKLVWYRISETHHNPEEVRTFEEMKTDPEFDNMKAIKDRGGKVPVHSHRETIARLPTKEEQELLVIDPHTPVLDITGINSAEDGTVIFIGHRCVVGDLAILTEDQDITYWK